MESADIPDEQILALVPVYDRMTLGISRWDLAQKFPEVPMRVLLAKMRDLVNAGKVLGCACGCRGDFSLPPRQTIQ